MFGDVRTRLNNSEVRSGQWYDRWISDKMGSDDDDVFRKLYCLPGWKLKYFVVWFLLVFFGFSALNFLGLDTWVCRIVLVVAVVGMPAAFVWLWRHVHGDSEVLEATRSIWLVLCRTPGVVSQSSNFADWAISDVVVNGSRISCTLRCSEPGVDLMKLRGAIEAQARVMVIMGQYPRSVVVERQGNFAYYTLILLFEQQGLQWEFFNESASNFWVLPRYKDSGLYTGEFALGEIVEGSHCGEVLKGRLFGPGGAYHIGLSGKSGWGKSNTLHYYFSQWARMPQVQIVYVDPQGTDGNLWKDRAIVVSGSFGDAGFNLSPCVDAVEVMMRICNERSQIMQQRGWSNWRCSVNEPCIVFAVDELSYLVDESKDMLRRLLNLSRTARKFGVALIFCTQYPVKRVVGDCWGQMSYRIGTKTNAPTETEVVFSEASRYCPAHELSSKGLFYVYSDSIYPSSATSTQLVQVPNGADKYAPAIAQATAEFRSADLARKFGVDKGPTYTYKKPGVYDDFNPDDWQF